jgi:AraC-like DNA-binding protein
MITPRKRRARPTDCAARDDIRFHNFPLAGVDAMTASTTRHFPRHTHDQYGVGVVDSGAHSSWSDQGQVEATPGNLICVNPGEVHDGRPLGEPSRAWRLLYLEPHTVTDALEDVSEGGSRDFMFVAPVFADESVRELFETAFAHVVTESRLAARILANDSMECETALLKLVACLRRHSTARTLEQHRPTACVARARARIDADPTARLTLAELASEAGLSRFQLIRGFARATGLTPHAYILQQRLALARQLIVRRRELAEVALLTGFYDQSHLTQYFVRQFGVTPRRYVDRAD